MRIRDYAREDAAALADLFGRSVRHFGPRAYDPAQVEAWAAGVSAQGTAARCGDGRTVLVAVDEEDRPLGYGDLEADGHLDHLYCAPEGEGRRVGSALYEEIERRALRQGLGRIHVEASELARPLFERRGFALVTRNAVRIGSVVLHNYSMEKRLDGEDGGGSAG